MDFSVGVGLTNACDLACAHCYRDVDRVDQLTETQVLGLCDDLPVRSVNLGTGENGLHPDYPAIVRALCARGVKLSLTSNGYTIAASSDETLTAFRELEVSIDFPTEREHDAFTLSYEEFWDGFRRLLGATRLVSTTEPILDAMLGQPFKTGTGCGRQTVRVTPKGTVIPCVYWGHSDLRIEDLREKGAEGVLASSEFQRVRSIPDACKPCPFVSTCQGGCAGRRELAGGVAMADPYCPLVRGDRVSLDWAQAERRELLKTGSACTTVLGPA